MPITITQEQLRAALLTWEQSHRAGNTRPYTETQALPAEQVADESAAYLFSLLSQATTAQVPA